MATYGDFIRMGNLATLARSDDRQAFDYLIAVALGNKPESANPELRKLSDSTAAAVISEMDNGLILTQTFKVPHTLEAMKKLMLDPGSTTRQAAIDGYPQEDKTILPILIQMITSDPSIAVLHKAAVRFNSLTKQQFEFWKTKDILEWWDKNRASFQ